MRGEPQDGFGGEGSGELAGTEHGSLEGFSSLVVGNDDDAGGVCGSDEEGQVKGACGEGQTRDTTAPRAPAQMAAYTLKGFGVFQVRQELADEG